MTKIQLTDCRSKSQHEKQSSAKAAQRKYRLSEKYKATLKKRRQNKKVLTQEVLKKLLHYTPKTGVFTWKVNRNHNVKSGDIGGCKHLHGYIHIVVDGKSYNASRLAFLWMEGYFPENDVDHINRVRDDNRWVNLRHISHQCNSRNCSIGKNNTSGVTGVDWHKQHGKWQSRARADGKTKNLGVFKSLDDAVLARWKAEVKYGYPNCNSDSSAVRYLQEKNLI